MLQGILEERDTKEDDSGPLAISGYPAWLDRLVVRVFSPSGGIVLLVVTISQGPALRRDAAI